MVESLKELNKICQKPDYKIKGNWYVRTILRDAALPVTRLLLHTSVTANQVTVASLIIAGAGMCLLTIPGTAMFFIGMLLLQLWYYLDHVDGQIARYRKTACLTGRFLDFMTHHIVHDALFLSLGFYCFFATQRIIFILWASISTLSIMSFNAVHDVKYKTFFEKLMSEGGRVRQKKNAPAPNVRVSLPRKLFSTLHKACEIHVMVNILTLTAVFQLTFPQIDMREILFLTYGTLAPILAITKIAYILKNRKIDEEYSNLFF